MFCILSSTTEQESPEPPTKSYELEFPFYPELNFDFQLQANASYNPVNQRINIRYISGWI